MPTCPSANTELGCEPLLPFRAEQEVIVKLFWGVLSYQGPSWKTDCSTWRAGPHQCRCFSLTRVSERPGRARTGTDAHPRTEAHIVLPETQLSSGLSAFAPPLLPWRFPPPRLSAFFRAEPGKVKVQVQLTRREGGHAWRCASVLVPAEERDLLENRKYQVVLLRCVSGSIFRKKDFTAT